MQPGAFDAPEMDIHCRCAMLQRARWALDEEELETLKERAEYYGLDKTEQFEDFKRKYLDAVEDAARNQPKTLDFSGGSGIIKVEKKSEWDNNLQPRAQVVEKIAEDDLYSFVAKELNIDQETATDMVDSVLAFTDDYYIDVRAFQRGEFPNAIDDIKEMSANIEEYIKKAPRWNGGETFRGVTVSDNELAKYVPGYKFDMGGTASWTNLSDKSADFANRNISYDRPNSVIYHSDTQSKGTGIRHISVFDLESEVLCSKDAKYVIIRTEKDHEGITHVYLKEVEI